MPTSAPTIRIDVSSKENLIVTLKEGNRKLPPIETRLDTAKLNEYREGLYRDLNQFRRAFRGGLEVEDWPRLSAAMSDLHKLGRKKNQQLFGGARHKVERFFKETCPGWQTYGSNDYVPPRVEIITRLKHSLPLEFFPLFDTQVPPAISNMKDLACVAARFLGFSTITYRIFQRDGESLPPPNLSDAEIGNRDGLSIRFFQHARLTGARREREFFESRADSIDLRGPWPADKFDLDRFVPELATQLWNASTGNASQPLDMIQHFACHCKTDETISSEEYSLKLAYREVGTQSPSYRERQAKIGDLQETIGSFPERQTDKPFPLVFLNACGPSKIIPAGVTSFPDLFLSDVGSRGVIGPETAIPDIFAAAFSEQFYKRLVDGEPLGQAIFLARRSLLTRHKNPLGILYAVYADPDLHVKKPLLEDSSVSESQST